MLSHKIPFLHTPNILQFNGLFLNKGLNFALYNIILFSFFE